MRYALVIPLLLVGLPAAHANGTVQHNSIHVLSTEPAPGTMRANQAAYVDDGTCPAGQIKMVIGAPDRNTPRQKSCVPR